MTTDQANSASDWPALDARHVWHPYTQMATASPPHAVLRGEGAYLYLSDGRRVFDAISSWWVTLHGHAHPHIAAAIARQAAVLEQVIHAGFAHEPAALLAARLAALLPGDLERIFYSDDGSTAVEVALKMCVGMWSNRGERRTRFLALDGAYHGDTFGAMSVSARSVFTRSVERLLFETVHLPFPAGDGAGEDGAALLLERADAELRRGDVAGLIVEPMVLGAGGMRVWSAAALRGLAGLCRSHGVPLIADEVMTGFGRTGRMFAVEHAGVVPDIICLAKGLTGGFVPLAVTACRAWIYDAFLSDDRARMLFHGHSFTANPIGCAAALACLEVFAREPVMERAAAIERVHNGRMAGLAARFDIRSPRVIGTIAAFDLPGDAGYLGEDGARLARYAFERGVFIRPLGDVVYLMPPLCTTVHELNELYDILIDGLERLPALG